MNTYLYLSITFFIISILTANYKTKSFYNAFLNAFLIFVYLIITIMYFSADYFTGMGITQAVLFTLETGLKGAGFSEYLVLIGVSVFLFIIVVILSYLYLRFIKHRKHPQPKRIKGMVHNFFLIFAYLVHPFNLDLYSIYKSLHAEQSTDFAIYYKKPNLSQKQIKNYNLVYIYAESLEKTYFDESIFPNLMPNLQELKKGATEFTNINQVVATGWTIGGITATQCGIPLFTTSQGNSMNGLDKFLSGATCIGDILKDKGYSLIFMQGSSLNFSGKGKFFHTHGFDEVYGFDELNKKSYNKNYRNGWGLYDDSLFPIVYEKFEELSKKEKPFSLFTLSLDTHHPNGQLSKSCKNNLYKDGQNSILNCVKCSDELISKFIRKIQNSKYAKKTIIVLTSDHLAMRNTASSYLKKNQRKNLFLIFDSNKKEYKPIDRIGSMVDIGATILYKLGINTDLGLGRNLFMTESLFTKFDNFNKKLLSWRESILKLWQFSKLGRNYFVDMSTKKINIGLQSYQMPLLAVISSDNSITPYFEFNSQKKLTEYLLQLKPKQKFIWVDKCYNINNVFDMNLSGKLCLAQGSLLSRKIEAKSLHSQNLKISTYKLFDNTEYETTMYRKRVSSLQRLLDGQCAPEGKISLVSSSMPTLQDIPSYICIFKKQFTVSRGLNLLTINYNDQYEVQNFDVYGDQNATNDLIKTLTPLINKKKFWVLVAHDAVSNTYPLYKESLKKLGFKLLPTLNFRVAYIGYVDKNGDINEFSDKNTLRKIINSPIIALDSKGNKSAMRLKE